MKKLVQVPIYAPRVYQGFLLLSVVLEGTVFFHFKLEKSKLCMCVP